MDKLYRLANVLQIVNKKEGSWRNLMKLKKAPSPIYLGSRSPRWRESELMEYLKDPIAYEINLQNKSK
ncbi:MULTISPECIES: helix-turn-helix transcriptional regulator [Sulfurospirillum]|uniref:Transcriptional regulator n=4 Tax=Sulfurospirillum TaxID=57665 RepID=A0A1Y0HL20_9BACT|nr:MULTISPECIES: AlpA family phage regulatory protein [Sulfurospirillum]AHJ12852.1 phage_AlpA superfamily protein [Sulfurospirillum multivorans DSM 12446]AOO65326.1 hypothetical protein SHALO_1551 [Sulfurospirillum halorespirans DSM 13726]ARU48807.1 hypothetical protein Sdiek1_1644 [Sulfurospirillum diekertiae]ASC93628.1 hypothetical protein Sdiek2_1610 [Sulfurospirillum diekertiae]ATB69672.1 hypothetical protein SJPD1_1563 [Sulfurospirillum diekertiae]